MARMNQMLSTPIQNADKNAWQNNIFEPNPISHQMRHSLQYIYSCIIYLYTIHIGYIHRSAENVAFCIPGVCICV